MCQIYGTLVSQSATLVLRSCGFNQFNQCALRRLNGLFCFFGLWTSPRRRHQRPRGLLKGHPPATAQSHIALRHQTKHRTCCPVHHFTSNSWKTRIFLQPFVFLFALPEVAIFSVLGSSFVRPERTWIFPSIRQALRVSPSRKRCDS